jgi:predicted branched-subunit amino acid permease
MDRSMLITCGLIGLGILAGALAIRLPLARKVAMVLALMPFGGIALAMRFC